MILENCSYLRDARVSKEARALTRWIRGIGHQSGVRPWPTRLQIEGVTVYGFPHMSFSSALSGIFWIRLRHTRYCRLTAYVWLTRGFDIVHSRIHRLSGSGHRIYKILANESFTTKQILAPNSTSLDFRVRVLCF